MDLIAPAIFSHFADSFSIHSSRDYCLSMIVARHSFSYCITRPEDNGLLGMEAYNFTIADTHHTEGSDSRDWCTQLTVLLGSLESLKKSFRQVSIVLESAKSTLVPQAIFREDDLAAWLAFNHPVADFEVIRKDEVPVAESIVLYTIPREILSALSDVFPEALMYSASGRLINCLLSATKEAARDGVLYANIHGSWVDLVYFEEGRLKFFNTFSYQTREDLAYYVIFVIEQLGLNPDTTVLVLIGDIERESDHFELLYRYIRNIRLIDNSIMLEGRQIDDAIPFHRYFILLNYTRCGS